MKSADNPAKKRVASLALQALNLGLVVAGFVAVDYWVSALSASVPLQWSGEQVTRMGSPQELWMTPAIMLFDLLILWFVVFAFRYEHAVRGQVLSERAKVLMLKRQQLSVRFTERVMLIMNASILVGAGLASMAAGDPSRGSPAGLTRSGMSTGCVFFRINVVVDQAGGPATSALGLVPEIVDAGIVDSAVGWIWGREVVRPRAPRPAEPERGRARFLRVRNGRFGIAMGRVVPS